MAVYPITLTGCEQARYLSLFFALFPPVRFGERIREAVLIALQHLRTPVDRMLAMELVASSFTSRDIRELSLRIYLFL